MWKKKNLNVFFVMERRKKKKVVVSKQWNPDSTPG
jgi:hypothetical protein